MADLLRLLFELVTHWETVVRGFSIFLVAIGMVCFVAHNRGGFRSLRIPGALPCCLGGFGLFWMRDVDSLDNRAKGVLELPQEARVLRVGEGDWSSEGTVAFTLPTNHSVKFWLSSVWEMNGFEAGKSSGTDVSCRSDEQGISYSDAEGSRSLSYDEVNHTYSYHSEW